MRHTARRGAWVLLLSVLLLTASGSAEASWLWTGTGTGSAVTTANPVTPVVTPTCTWNSTTGAFTVLVSWTKSTYALTTSVRRRDVVAGTTVTLATNLGATVTSIGDSVPFTAPNGAGKTSTTKTYTYTVIATAGSFWARTGSVSKAFTLTNAKNGTPDSCT